MSRSCRFAMLLAAALAFLLGGMAHRSYPRLMGWISAERSEFRWPDGFAVVEIESSIDGSKQKAVFRSAGAGPKRPLLVSLHTWAGNYYSPDSLAPLAARDGWNYIHPDFRGPNRGPDNCLSAKVLTDIDDAIGYALRTGNVDVENIFVVGFSGGGYATLGAYVRSTQPVRAYLAWAPIADLAAWHDESAARGNVDYSRQIRQCTGSGDTLDRELARLRSPLFWTLPRDSRPRLEIYAGIADGYTGSVPISHSIRFFNRLAEARGLATPYVTLEEMAALLGRGVTEGSTPKVLSGRTVLFHRNAPFGSLTVFQGSHELPAVPCFARLQSMVRREDPPEDYKPGS